MFEKLKSYWEGFIEWIRVHPKTMAIIAVCVAAYFLTGVSFGKDCISPNKFLSNARVDKSNIPVYVLTGEKAQAFFESTKMDADTLLTARLDDRQQGIASFKDGCLVNGSAIIAPTLIFFEVLNKNGIKPEDFRLFDTRGSDV